MKGCILSSFKSVLLTRFVPFCEQTVRHYHGHLSACYDLDLHPTIDILVTCGRDATVRVCVCVCVCV